MPKLLTKQTSTAKLAKNIKVDADFMSWIMYLAPSDIVSGINVCPAATSGCRAACLYSAGRGRFSSVQLARIQRTELFRDDRETFIHQLVREIDNAIKYARKKGLKPAFRLNGTSDIDFESEIRAFYPFFYEEREDAVFYEYTKRPDLALNPSPIRFTFSVSEANRHVATKVLSRGGNVAAVFGALPDIWLGYRVINGDLHDMRFLDPSGPVVVGLLPKGDAKKDQSGFVIREAS